GQPHPGALRGPGRLRRPAGGERRLGEVSTPPEAGSVVHPPAPLLRARRPYAGRVIPQVVLVHGIRTSATMWRSQLAHLDARGIPAVAPDLPGHGTRMAEPFTLAGALETIDQAVQDAATRGPVLLAGHSMGGLVSCAYVGQEYPPPVAAFIGASCTALPRGTGLAAYRMLARGFDSLPDRGLWISGRVLDATLPEDTRLDFGAGGYALDAQDTVLASLAALDLATAVQRIRI